MAEHDEPAMSDRFAPPGRLAMVAIAVLAIAAYAMSVSAIRTKSATADEPLHLVAAYMHVFHSDYRLDPEDPPLWSWLAMALVPRSAIRVDLAQPIDPAITIKFIDRTLWLNSGSSAFAALERARMGMALLAPVLLLLCAFCAWKLAGPAAALATAMLLAFDPLLLGHAPLVKNDVAITLGAVALLASLVALMRRPSPARAILFALFCAACVTVKFSGLLLVTFAVAALLLHAAISRSPRQVYVATGATLLSVLISWCAVWTVYGFHFAPTRDASSHLDQQWYVTDYAKRQLLADLGRPASDSKLAQWKPDATVKLVRFAFEHHLLPESFLVGLLYTRGSSFGRHAYLLGQLSYSGRWYYFPLALLFKLPTATIAAIVGGVVAVIIAAVLRRGHILSEERTRAWLLAGGMVGGGYFLLAMLSNVNIGVRHVMPSLAVAYLAVGVAFAHLRSARPQAAKVAAWVLGIMLVSESALAWPNYIAFFNFVSGGPRGGIRLLADSNLDWGQDLPLLADWQAKHPGARLYLCYFGSVPPEAYGIDYTNLPGGYWTSPQQMPSTPGVIAVSATRLQCLYLPPEIAPFYYDLRANHKPREVLGGTIYLYDFPLKK